MACSTGADDGSGEGSNDGGKYTQTWTKDYAATTCREWNVEVTEDQQWVAAADMLTGARNKGDGGEGLPPESLVNEFKSGITTTCVVPTMSLSETAAGPYLTGRARFQP